MAFPPATDSHKESMKVLPYKAQGMTATECYNALNSNFFKGKLPPLRVYWNWKRSSLGATAFDRESKRPLFITLNPHYRYLDRIWLPTLLHEMVHVEQWRLPIKDKHGVKFISRMRKLARDGAFDSLW